MQLSCNPCDICHFLEKTVTSKAMETSGKDSATARIIRFLDGIDRWRDETDAPPYIDALISTPIRDIQAIHCPRRVELGAAIVEVIEAFKGSRNVVVHTSSTQTSDFADTRIFSRLCFLEHALEAPSFLEPLSSIADNVPVLGWVTGDDTLDTALQRMIMTGFEEVGIMNEGLMTGVLQLDDIFSFLLREVAVCGEDDEAEFKRTRSSQIFHNNDGDSKPVRVKVEREERRKETSPLQLSAIEWCESGWTEALIMCCVLLDLSCAGVEWRLNQSYSDQPRLLVATGIILFMYVFEMGVRIIGRRTGIVFRPFETVDASIVIASVTVFSLIISNALAQDVTTTTVMRILRLLRQIKIIRFLYRWYALQKLKYRQDGFSLDLSYITSSCVAMSRPVDIPDAKFVNSIKELRRFFVTKYKARYLIFNVSHECTYDDEYFGGRVETIKVQSHNPPTMHQVVTFAEHAGRFMNQHPDGCIAVHCTHGSGRTGIMVSAWLLYSGFASTADDAMKWFASRRMGKRASAVKGVPMVSQRRYVAYMHDALICGGYYTKRLHLNKIVVKDCPLMDSAGGSNLWFTIEEGGMEVFSSPSALHDGVVPFAKAQAEASFNLGILVAGDVRVIFFHRDQTACTDRVCFFLCFHTGFLESSTAVFDKSNVDMAAEDSKCQIFGKKFAVQMEFDDIPWPREPLAPAAKDFGVALGPFRRILKASQQVTDAAALMRCRDLNVQAKFAKELQKKVRKTTRLSLVIRLQRHAESRAGGKDKFESSNTTVQSGRRTVRECSWDTLCCALGPVVEHEDVQMFKAEGHVLPLMVAKSLPAQGSLVALNPITRSVQGLARSLVSGNKRRFTEDGFDLDLSYVTPRIIAMGYPSKGIEGHYRNPVQEVYRFFQERHAAHYLIVNLCSEREYELDTFHGNCVRYPFPDHNPPALELILPCCARMHAFLQADPNNVVAVHCKAGKGRTGLMLVAYLMYCGQQISAAAARLFYDWTRTKDGKGLTIISQIRYVHYFEQLLLSFKIGVPLGGLRVAQDQSPAVRLLGIRLHSPPRMEGGGTANNNSFAFTVSCKWEVDHVEYEIFSSGRESGSPAADDAWLCYGDPHGTCCDLRPAADQGAQRVAGDFNMSFYYGSGGPKIFHFWLHTAMMADPPDEMCGKARQMSDEEREQEGLPPSAESLILYKAEIDTAAKDRRCARFDTDFRVELFYEPLAGETGTGPALDEARRRRTESEGEPTRGTPEPPLQWERDRYRRYMAMLVRRGIDEGAPNFEEWLLGRRAVGGENIDCEVRGAASIRRDSTGRNSARGRPTYDYSIDVAPSAAASETSAAQTDFVAGDNNVALSAVIVVDSDPAAEADGSRPAHQAKSGQSSSAPSSPIRGPQSPNRGPAELARSTFSPPPSLIEANWDFVDKLVREDSASEPALRVEPLDPNREEVPSAHARQHCLQP